MSNDQPQVSQLAPSPMDLVHEAETIATLSRAGVVSVQDLAAQTIRLTCSTMVVLLGKMEHIEDVVAGENEGEIKEIAEGYLEKRVTAEMHETLDRFEGIEKLARDLHTRVVNLEAKLADLSNQIARANLHAAGASVAPSQPIEGIANE